MTPTLMAPDARTVFERAGGRQILVVGDLMVDEWIWGTVTRISPEAPVPVVAVADHSFTLGGAGNVANNLRALRADVVFAGTVGDDAFAEQIRDLLRAEQVDDSGVFTMLDRPDHAQDADRRPQPASRARRLGVAFRTLRGRSPASGRFRSRARGEMRRRHS